MQSVKSRDRFPLTTLYGLQQGCLAAYVVHCLLLTVQSSTPRSVFLANSKIVDCCSTGLQETQALAWDFNMDNPGFFNFRLAVPINCEDSHSQATEPIREKHVSDR